MSGPQHRRQIPLQFDSELALVGCQDNGVDEPAKRLRGLRALQEKLLRQDLFEEFCDEFTREMNRLRMEHRAGLSSAEREIERIEVRRKKLIEMVMDGVAPSEVKDEVNTNAAKREELKARLASADAPPPLLHRRWRGCTAKKSLHWHKPWNIQKHAQKPLRRFAASSTPLS